MNVLLITYDFYPLKGGIAYTLMTLAKYFRKKRDTLYIINPFTKDKNTFDILDNSPFKYKDLLVLFKKEYLKFGVISLFKILKDKRTKLSHRINLILYLFSKPKLLISNLKNIRNIVPIFKKIDIDVIFTGDSGNALTLAFLLSRLFNKKLVSMGHGMDLLAKRYLSLKHFYIRNVDLLILSNNWIKKLVKKYHNFEKVSIVHRGIITDELKVDTSKSKLREKYGIPIDSFILLSVGRQIPRKNFDLVIEAVKEIKNKYSDKDIKYYLVGEGPYTPYLKELTSKYILEDSIIFLGATDFLTRNEFYKLSDVFIMPSITKKNDIEGFGIVFIEANYYKVPVIGTKSGGIVEAIVDGETGFLIGRNDLNDLVDKILFLYNNEDKRIEMGEKGYIRVIEQFNWENVIDDYIRSLKSVL